MEEECLVALRCYNKNEITMDVGGSSSHSEFVCGKSSQNSPILPSTDILLWGTIPCVFSVYGLSVCIRYQRFVVIMI